MNNHYIKDGERLESGNIQPVSAGSSSSANCEKCSPVPKALGKSVGRLDGFDLPRLKGCHSYVVRTMTRKK